MNKEIDQWNKQLANSSAEEIIAFFTSKFSDKISLSSSLGLEDQVLTEIVSRISPATEIFTLDTGRLFPETYDLIDLTSKKYKKAIKIYFPDSKEVEEMVAEKGINLFYDSIENRKLCCGIRKIQPLKRALKGLDAWITGLRREQSVTRTNLNIVEWDEANQLLKVNPLINWTEEDVWDYIEKKNVPYNKLHKQGFASIGCQPCTRAIEDGEDVRAGRWWWENPETKECGLHVK
ncbi:MAG: phosphoadenylyl-sulfate reductase [Marinilabiliales bacterium]|nr:MAG: phosphoadenylyl-sulfate reductase [Marinilabiliales bacterium]